MDAELITGHILHHNKTSLSLGNEFAAAAPQGQAGLRGLRGSSGNVAAANRDEARPLCAQAAQAAGQGQQQGRLPGASARLIDAAQAGRLRLLAARAASGQDGRGEYMRFHCILLVPRAVVKVCWITFVSVTAFTRRANAPRFPVLTDRWKCDGASVLCAMRC